MIRSGRRVLKLEGYQPSNGPAQWQLPEGRYFITAGEGTGEYVELNISRGPAGLGIRLNTWRSSEPLTVEMEGATAYPRPDVYEVNITRYKDDVDSQKFKGWYNTNPAERDPQAPVLPTGAPLAS